jgi:hypothetical protein
MIVVQITQIFLFFLFVFSHLPIFSTSYLPSFRVPSCNFVANFLVIFIGIPYKGCTLRPETMKIAREYSSLTLLTLLTSLTSFG